MNNKLYLSNLFDDQYSTFWGLNGALPLCFYDRVNQYEDIYMIDNLLGIYGKLDRYKPINQELLFYLHLKKNISMQIGVMISNEYNLIGKHPLSRLILGKLHLCNKPI